MNNHAGDARDGLQRIRPPAREDLVAYGNAVPVKSETSSATKSITAVNPIIGSALPFIGRFIVALDGPQFRAQYLGMPANRIRANGLADYMRLGSAYERLLRHSRTTDLFAAGIDAKARPSAPDEVCHSVSARERPPNPATTLIERTCRPSQSAGESESGGLNIA